MKKIILIALMGLTISSCAQDYDFAFSGISQETAIELGDINIQSPDLSFVATESEVVMSENGAKIIHKVLGVRKRLFFTEYVVSYETKEWVEGEDGIIIAFRFRERNLPLCKSQRVRILRSGEQDKILSKYRMVGKW